ncbi:MAG: RNA polymerase sigma factor [Candidatus Zixiibacteriota bacterium]|nr:MAG: RNA polymerase sigma factor [candidate division Zixibacteria bacterium]
MNRNRELFWKLIKPEHVKVRAFCRKLMGSRDDGDDLYQDALVLALTRFADLRNGNAVRPWLYRIVVNTFKNRIRRSRWKNLISLTPEIADTVGMADPSPAYAARRKLERAFRALSAEDRALITLFELEGWSLVELAGLTGKRESAIKVRLFRARRRMREILVRSQSPTEYARTVESAVSEEDICAVPKPNAD